MMPDLRWLPFAAGLFALTLLAFLCGRALAHDNDPANDAWYASLVSPVTGLSCRNKNDCKPRDHHQTADGYEVLIDGEWLPVPPDVILQRIPNPTGRAVACYLPWRGIMCFVRPTES